MLMEPRASRAFLVDLGIDPIKFLKNGAVFQRVINESASEFRKMLRPILDHCARSCGHFRGIGRLRGTSGVDIC